VKTQGKSDLTALQEFAPRADEEEKTLLRYIYRSIPPREYTAAVSWEYGRVSPRLCYWSRLLNRTGMSSEELIGRLTVRALNMAHTSFRDPIRESKKPNDERTRMCQLPHALLGFEWRSIWTSKSFPHKRWLMLEDLERREICRGFSGLQKLKRSLPVADVRLLSGLKVLRHWQELAADTRLDACVDTVPARFERNGFEDVIFTISYRDGKDAVRKAFGRWLDDPVQRGLFARFKERKTGKDLPSVRLPQALRDLAIRQIRQRCGGTEAAVKWLSAVRVQKAGSSTDIERMSGKRLKVLSERNVRDAVTNSEKFEADLFASF